MRGRIVRSRGDREDFVTPGQHDQPRTDLADRPAFYFYTGLRHALCHYPHEFLWCLPSPQSAGVIIAAANPEMSAFHRPGS